jgi:mycothiol synthase
MTALDIRPKTPDDDAWIVDLRNRLNAEDLPLTVEVMRHWDAVEEKAEQAHVENYVAERQGQRLGMATLSKMWWSKRPGGFWGAVRVEPDHKGQGFGSDIYTFMVTRLQALDAQRLYSGVREDDSDSRGFAQRRGFHETGHSNRRSRLEVANVNLDDGYQGLEERLAGEGITAKTLAELSGNWDEHDVAKLGLDDLLRKLHAVSDEAVADIPASEEFSGSPYEMFLAELSGPEIIPDRIWVALDGDEPIGIAMLPCTNSENGLNGFTGTARAHRGRGIARLLKLKTIRYCQTHGVKFIYTANDIKNTRMLDINVRMGYKPVPSALELVKEFA